LALMDGLAGHRATDGGNRQGVASSRTGAFGSGPKSHACLPRRRTTTVSGIARVGHLVSRAARPTTQTHVAAGLRIEGFPVLLGWFSPVAGFARYLRIAPAIL